MEVIIKGEPEEIAALVLAAQGRQSAESIKRDVERIKDVLIHRGCSPEFLHKS